MIYPPFRAERIERLEYGLSQRIVAMHIYIPIYVPGYWRRCCLGQAACGMTFLVEVCYEDLTKQNVNRGYLD